MKYAANGFGLRANGPRPPATYKAKYSQPETTKTSPAAAIPITLSEQIVTTSETAHLWVDDTPTTIPKTSAEKISRSPRFQVTIPKINGRLMLTALSALTVLGVATTILLATYSGFMENNVRILTTEGTETTTTVTLPVPLNAIPTASIIDVTSTSTGALQRILHSWRAIPVEATYRVLDNQTVQLTSTGLYPALCITGACTAGRSYEIPVEKIIRVRNPGTN